MHPSKNWGITLPLGAERREIITLPLGAERREILDAEWFTTTKQAQIVINHWLRQ